VTCGPTRPPVGSELACGGSVFTSQFVPMDQQWLLTSTEHEHHPVVHGTAGEVAGSCPPDQEPALPHLLEANLAISSKFPTLRLLFLGHCLNTQPTWIPSQPSAGMEGAHWWNQRNLIVPLSRGREIMRTVFGRNGDTSHMPLLAWVCPALC